MSSIYAILSQRNVGSDNAYVQINELSPTESPQRAAAKIFNVRGVYSAKTLGGKVTVESFYRLLRCEDDSCFSISRVIAVDVNGGEYNLRYPLTLVKSTMGNSSWLINAHQSPVNALLDTADERPYTDPVYKGFTLYHKAVRPPLAPCSSALPLTRAGSISEFEAVLGYGCMAYRGLNITVGTSTGDMISMMRKNAVPWSQCNGSLLMVYVLGYDQGPRIYRVIQKPGSVPFTVEINLPVNSQLCHPLYAGGPDNSLQAALAILQSSFNTTPGPVPVLPSIQRLGFNGSCGPTYSYGRYGSYAAGQSEALTDGVTDPEFVGSFLPYNSDPSQVCVSMLSASQPDSGTRDMSEDQCAQLYVGNPTQQSEGIITFENADPDSSRTVETLLFESDLLSECEGARYNLSMDLVLPQIAVDFEGKKNFLVSSAEVRRISGGTLLSGESV